MKYHFFALAVWFLGLLAFAKGVKLVAFAYPAEKLIKFKRFTAWFLFIAATAGLICIATKSFMPYKSGYMSDGKGCNECPMMQGGSCSAQDKK